MITHSVLHSFCYWCPCKLLRPCEDLITHHQETKSSKCNSALQDNTSCQHQATTSIRKIIYMAKDVGSFNLFYCEQRDKSLVPRFPGHRVVFFFSISLFFTLLYLTIFFPSVCYYWPCHSGTEPQLIHSLDCTLFCALPLILAHFSSESNPTHWETLNCRAKGQLLFYST